MSAFFVNTAVIHDVITAMRPALMTNDDAANEFGKQLIQMNIDSLKARYEVEGEELAGYEKARDAYSFVESKDQPEIQLLKSLGCFTYQCCEGDVPETPLYKKCEGYEAELTSLLPVGKDGRVKGWDTATWNRT